MTKGMASELEVRWEARAAAAAVVALIACRSWTYAERIQWANEDPVPNRQQACASDADCVRVPECQPEYCIHRAFVPERSAEEQADVCGQLVNLLAQCRVLASDDDCLCVSGLCIHGGTPQCE
jgi:hypothetical protein